MRWIVVAVLVLAGCTTIEEDATRHCGDNDACRAHYIAREEARIDRENAMVGAMIMNRPVQTTCMNIGGIVTCNSR